MAGILVIGDEITCTGFRLTGVETRTPAAEETRETFQKALSGAALIIITAEYALRLPRAALDAAMATEAPAIVVIPDVRENEQPPDLAASIRETLGIEG
jgi:vacuolar-type H+-ATPase subunit F/Vma7